MQHNEGLTEWKMLNFNDTYHNPVIHFYET